MPSGGGDDASQTTSASKKQKRRLEKSAKSSNEEFVAYDYGKVDINQLLQGIHQNVQLTLLEYCFQYRQMPLLYYSIRFCTRVFEGQCELVQCQIH
jgi:hypothetical protein